MIIIALAVIFIAFGGGIGFWAREAEIPSLEELLIFTATFGGVVLFPSYVRRAAQGIWGTDFVQGWLMRRLTQIQMALGGDMASLEWTTLAVLVFVIVLTAIIIEKAKIALYALAIAVATRWVLLSQVGVDPASLIDSLLSVV